MALPAHAYDPGPEETKAKYRETDHIKTYLPSKQLRIGRSPHAHQAQIIAAWAGKTVCGSRRRANNLVDRRSFLKSSGLTAGALASVGTLRPGSIRKAEAATAAQSGAVELRKNICTHCSVGCTVTAEVANGVWIGQEPSWDSPINRGSHCAKGASVRELVSGERRLKYPMKLVNGAMEARSTGTRRSTRSATS